MIMLRNRMMMNIMLIIMRKRCRGMACRSKG